MLEDSLHHHGKCPVEPFKAPAEELPNRFRDLVPSIQNKHGNTVPGHSRQVAFNATNEAGGYALFTDYRDWKAFGMAGSLSEYLARGPVPLVWRTATFEGVSEEKDKFNRVLHIALFGKLSFLSLVRWQNH